MKLNYDLYYEKVLGGWIGRVAGSQFGTPLEFKPYRWITKRYCDNGRKDIDYYVKPVNPAAVNDDEIYEIVGLLTLKKKGLDITSKDIAESWNELLYGKQYTAEKIALNNIRKGIMPPDCASEKYGNIFYDAIGAQMKSDIWGLIAPGLPEIAAKYAKIDGAVAHQGIGIDGEIFIATLISNSFLYSYKDLKPGIMQNLLKKSLNFIDQNSLYAEMIEFCFKLYENNKNWRDSRKLLTKKWNSIRKKLKKSSSLKRRIIFLNKGLGLVHVLPNAGIITLSLLYGQDHFPEDVSIFDSNEEINVFGRPICLAGMMGMDTDCNCGNIGTIMGVLLGESKIPNKWKNPLNNEFHTLVKNACDWKITELAKEIADIGVKVANIRQNLGENDN